MKVPESDPVAAVTNLISVVSDEIALVNCFKGKWSTVRTKLALLHSQFSDFSDFPSFSSNPLSADLLRSLDGTLSDTLSLARECRAPSPAGGKLRTQSDIDSVSANLDRHLKDGEVLIRSGALLMVRSGGVGRGGGFGTAREAVRAESRDLITRLQIGSKDSKNSAMDALLDLLHRDDKHVLIAVAQGIVPVLVQLLDSRCLELKEKTVSAISRVSAVDSSKHVLMAEGLFLLNHLLRVLESGSGFAKEKACITLRALTSAKENAIAVGSRGGVSSLLEICQAGTPGSRAVAASVLRNLASFHEIRANFMEENAVEVLMRLSASGTVSAQENAIECLSNLVSGDLNLKLLIAREGMVDCLKNFWDGALAVQSLKPAVELLRTFASCPPISELLVSNGFLPRLVSVLNCGVWGVRIAAAEAIYELSLLLGPKTRREIGECGCIPLLIGMLEAKGVDEKEAAAKTLSNLLLCANNRRVFRKDERGILSSVHLLEPSVQSLDKSYPVSILASMAHSKDCRKQIIAAGACPHLQKLVGMKVEGAKKLLDSLNHGKLWRVFSTP